MFLLAVFTFVLAFLGSEGRNRLVTLTPKQESFVIYGGKLADYPLLTVEAECPDGDCRVLLELSISNPKSTNFSVFSQDGLYTYSHETIPPFFILSVPISFLSDPQSDKNFVASFRLWLGVDEEGWLPSALLPIKESGSGIVQLDGTATRAVSLALERHDHPVLKIYTPQVSEGCILHVFAGGLPTAKAIVDSDALLFKYDGSAPFQNSFLKNEVVTAWIPENCTASFIYHSISPETLEVADFKPSTGILMSYEWEDPLGDAALYDESIEIDLLGDEAQPNRTIYLVVEASPSIGGSLWLQTATASGNSIWQTNITLQLNETYRAHGQRFSAKWQPGNERIYQGFSVFYWIVDGEETTQSSTPKTTTTKTQESTSTSETETSTSTTTTTTTTVTTVTTSINKKTTSISSTSTIPSKASSSTKTMETTTMTERSDSTPSTTQGVRSTTKNSKETSSTHATSPQPPPPPTSTHKTEPKSKSAINHHFFPMYLLFSFLYFIQ